MANAFGDPSAEAVCILAYCESDNLEDVTIYKGVTKGKIVEPKGSTHFGWDCIFQPDGFEKTYGELDAEIKNTISHRSKALQLLVKKFAKK